jgi:hypothetical protein
MSSLARHLTPEELEERTTQARFKRVLMESSFRTIFARGDCVERLQMGSRMLPFCWRFKLGHTRVVRKHFAIVDLLWEVDPPARHRRHNISMLLDLNFVGCVTRTQFIEKSPKSTDNSELSERVCTVQRFAEMREREHPQASAQCDLGVKACDSCLIVQIFRLMSYLTRTPVSRSDSPVPSRVGDPSSYRAAGVQIRLGVHEAVSENGPAPRCTTVGYVGSPERIQLEPVSNLFRK